MMTTRPLALVRASKSLLFEDRLRAASDGGAEPEITFLYESSNDVAQWHGRGYYWRTSSTTLYTLFGFNAPAVRRRLRQIEIRAGVRPKPERLTLLEVLNVASLVLGVVSTTKNLITND